MVVMAHPDDAELYCGGTIARLTADGKEVMMVKVTSGEAGSRQEKITKEQLGKLRESEDSVAMKALGIKEENNVYLRMPDGGVENGLATIGKIAEQIRIFKPELIITHNPEDMIIRFDKDVNWINHRDHQTTGKVAIYAAYPYARDLLFFPEHFNNPKTSSHAVTEFLLVDFYNHPDLVCVDMTDYIETRVKAHASHSSQYTVEHAQESADFLQN